MKNNIFESLFINYDLLDYIFNYLKLGYLYNLLLLNKDINQIVSNIDQYLWFKIAINEYSKEFWDKANNRSKIISKPLNCYKLELKRLRRYENCLLKNNEPITLQYYYHLWNAQEQFYQKKKLISRFAKNDNYHRNFLFV